jgi:hypothetical protein
VIASGHAVDGAGPSARGLTDAILETAGELADLAKEYLASEQGRVLRRRLAGALILGAPLISEMPVIRRTLAARILRTAAVGTLLIKGAEWIRDWESASSVEVVPPD